MLLPFRIRRPYCRQHLLRLCSCLALPSVSSTRSAWNCSSGNRRPAPAIRDLHGGDFSILAEAFGGAKTQFLGDQSVLGVGGRALFTLASDGNRNALLVGPGLGVSYWEAKEHARGFWDRRWGESDRYFINLDVNVGWLRELSPDFGWELGVNFGLRVGLSGEDRHDRDVSGRISGGTIGLYTGLRF